MVYNLDQQHMCVQCMRISTNIPPSSFRFSLLNNTYICFLYLILKSYIRAKLIDLFVIYWCSLFEKKRLCMCIFPIFNITAVRNKKMQLGVLSCTKVAMLVKIIMFFFFFYICLPDQNFSDCALYLFIYFLYSFRPFYLLMKKYFWDVWKDEVKFQYI